MTRQELDVLWKDPANWNRDGIYNCPTDPRLSVPKRIGGGWTLNLGHPKGLVAFWALVLGIIAPVVAIAAMRGGLPAAALIAGAFALLIGGIVAFEQFRKWQVRRSNRQRT